MQLLSKVNWVLRNARAARDVAIEHRQEALGVGGITDLEADIEDQPALPQLEPAIPLWADHSRLATPAASTTASVPLPP